MITGLRCVLKLRRQLTEAVQPPPGCSLPEMRQWYIEMQLSRQPASRERVPAAPVSARSSAS